MRVHKSTQNRGAQQLFPFPHQEPKVEEQVIKTKKERGTMGLYKQAALFRNDKLAEKYVYNDKNAWGWIKNVWEWKNSQYKDKFEYDRPVEKNRWRFLFKMLEKEKENDYKRLKKSWNGLGDFRKTIIFAMSRANEEHKEFLTELLKERLPIKNDTLPNIFNSLIEGFLHLMFKKQDPDISWGRRMTVEEIEEKIREKYADYPERTIKGSIIDEVNRDIYKELLWFFKNLGLSKEEIEKIRRKWNKENGEIFLRYVNNWLKEVGKGYLVLH